MRAFWAIGCAIIAAWAGPLAAEEDMTAPERCPDAVTTLDMDHCIAAIVQRAQERQAKYLAAAIARYADESEVTDRIKASDAAFSEYERAECGAVYQLWIEGSIRNVMALQCKLVLIDRRTHTIWRNWLTYMDSTPPILPEPEPTSQGPMLPPGPVSQIRPPS
jgi:uncharacterized protein YecT (DUF1311 family)